MTIVAGTDIGLSGAVAAIDVERMHVLWAWDMPTVDTIVSGKVRARIDIAALAQYYQALLDMGCVLSTVETPGYRKGQVGSGQVGRNYGQIEGLHAALMLRIEPVESSAWKASIKVPKLKTGAIKRAEALFPGSSDKYVGPKGGAIDGRAEAAMIALFGARRHLGIRTAI